jgi:anti-anti-sigma factor
MTISLETHPEGVAVVRLAGRLDLTAAGEVRQRLSAAVAGGHRRLVIDLAEVAAVDNSGLGALVGGLKAARTAGGDLRLARPGQQPRRTLRLTALDRVFRPHDTLDEALVGW